MLVISKSFRFNLKLKLMFLMFKNDLNKIWYEKVDMNLNYKVDF